MRARSSVDLHGPHIGGSVVLPFENGDANRPIVVGVLGVAHRMAHRKPAQVEVVPTANAWSSPRVNSCPALRKASITLTKAGKVLIEGSYLLSRSTGVNRIKGGSVQLNWRRTAPGTDQRHPHGRRLQHGPGGERPRVAGGHQGHLRSAQTGRAGAPGR